MNKYLEKIASKTDLVKAIARKKHKVTTMIDRETAVKGGALTTVAGTAVGYAAGKSHGKYDKNHKKKNK